MSFATRANKSGSGGPDYAKNTTILSDEVNTDFNTIYGFFNGQITDINVEADAAIQGSKLANGSVTTTQIASNTILNVNVNTNANISRTKLAPPVTLGTQIVSSLVFNTETTIAVLTFTPVAGPIIFTGAGFLSHGGSVGGGTITFRWKRDGVVQGTTITADVQVGANKVPVTIPNFVDLGPISGSHTWSLTAEVSDGTLFTSATPGYVFAVEVR